MSDRTKDLILKTLLVIGMILLFMLFPGGIFLSLLVPNEEVALIILSYSLFLEWGFCL